MASSQPPAIVTSKATNSSGQSSPAQSQAGSIASGDSHGQKRSGGSGSFGAGATSRASPTPRNNQPSRKQHKGSKRFHRLVDEDAIAESAAMNSANSRKGRTSITHLMSFSLPPRPQNHLYHGHGHGHGRNVRRTPAWGPGSGYHAADKARYVHANYRFIVDPRGDYHDLSVDADVFLDWNNVFQILVSSQYQAASCPICLETPVAPRMAKCGHIFCLPCLIRYMHADEDSNHHHPEKRPRWKKCPICDHSIYVSETRPVRWYIGQESAPPREGGDIVLRLIMRTPGSTLALPRDGADALAKGDDIPWHIAAEVMDYARIIKGSEDYMLEQFDKDIADVEAQEKEDELMFGGDSAEWTHKAIRAIKEAKDKMKDIGNPPALPSKPVESKAKRPLLEPSSEDVPDMYTIQQSDSALRDRPIEEGTPVLLTPSVDPIATSTNSASDVGSSTAPITVSSDTSTPSTKPNAPTPNLFRTRNTVSSPQPPSEYYFYQALPHYYLSPLDIRILKEAFGNFVSFPATILPRVERVSTGHIIDDDLRRRAKYLAHLPYGCEVSFVECDWTDTVPPAIIERFKADIERRRKRNHDKEAREEKARLKAERDEEEQHRYASARRKRSEFSANGFSEDDFQPLVSAEVAETAASIDGDMTSTSPPWPDRPQGSSFSALASISTSPNTSRTVWGTAAIPPSSPTLQAIPQEHDVVDDGWLQGWEKDLMQEEDMVAQAQALSLGGESSKAGAATGGKKKKGKKITLMSTSVRRHA